MSVPPKERYGRPRPADMMLEQAVQFALRLLKTAAKFDAATGGGDPETRTFATIKVLRPAGVECIPPELQTKCFAGDDSG